MVKVGDLLLELDPTDLEVGVKISEDFKPKEVPDVRDRTFEYLSTKGQRISYRLATGNDQVEVLRRPGASTAEMNTILLSNCITEVDGNLVVDPVFFARTLAMRDRQAILGQTHEKARHRPTVSLTIEIPCDSCGEGQQINFGWLDFFRP